MAASDPAGGRGFQGEFQRGLQGGLQGGQGRNPAIANYLAQVPAQYLAEFRQEQAEHNSFFVNYRAGLSVHAHAPGPNRPQPAGVRNGYWDGRHSTDQPRAIREQTRQRWLFRDLGPGGPRQGGWRADAANRAARAARRYLRSQGCSVSLLSVLGFGGMGVASLFEVDPGRGRQRKKVVIKSMLQSLTGVSLQEEKSYNGVRLGRFLSFVWLWACCPGV
jgi:hypothetical protein